MARAWALCATILVGAVLFQSLSIAGVAPDLSTIASAQTCLGSGVSASPSQITPPGQVTLTADGFAPGTTVNISIQPPPTWSFSAQSQGQAGANCRASSVVSIEPCSTCQSGQALVTASGTSAGGGAVQYSGTLYINNPSSSNSSQASSSQFPTYTPTMQSVSPTCVVPSASTSPAVISQGSSTTFVANGYAPGSSVNLQITGPGPSSTVLAQANSLCQVASSILFELTDPPGVWTITSSGSPYYSPSHSSFSVQVLTQSANVNVLPVATATPTLNTTGSSTVCPNPSVQISGAPLTSGQSAFFSATGFRPGSMATLRVEDLNVPGSSFPFTFSTDLGPAATNCTVTGTLMANGTVPFSRYRLILNGTNSSGVPITTASVFDYVSQTGPTSTPTSFVETGPTATPITSFPPTSTPTTTGQQGPPAPLAVEQTLNLTGGPPVPQVNQTNTYEHVIRLTNTSGRALDPGAFARLMEVFAASMQGQGINSTFTTDYAPGSRIVSAQSSIGTAEVRGASVTWTGQLQAGESVDIRTTLDFTPTTALALNQPILGQSVTVADVQGQSLAFAPPPPPQLPVAQRIVQPTPPPVDPITGNRYFSDTGFAISNDDLWTYFVRRGGQKVFGRPISRDFLLMGSQVQLFEKGMIGIDADQNVRAVNLLDEPYLPYEAFGDLRLPAVDPNLIDSTPDPSAPNYSDLIQEYIRVNAAESFDQKSTRFYSTFLGSVLYSDAFFLGPGDAGLLPGFDLEVWGLPTSPPGYQVVGYNVLPGAGPDGEDVMDPILDTSVVLQRFQRGVMRYNAATGVSSGAMIGPYLQMLLTGQITDPEFADAAAYSPLWGQYNPDGDPVTWLDRPDDLPDSNLTLAFEPLTE